MFDVEKTNWTYYYMEFVPSVAIASVCLEPLVLLKAFHGSSQEQNNI